MLPSSFARMIAGFAKGLYPEAEYQPVAAVRNPDGGNRVTAGGIALQSASDWAVRSKIVALGDSWTARYRNITGHSRGSSYLHWAKSLLDDVDVDFVDAGVAGNTTAQMLARFDADVAPHNPVAVVIFGGINDGATGVPAATTIANIDAIVQRTLSIGALPILITVPVVTSYAATAQNVANRLSVNAAIRSYSGKSCIVIDAYSALLMPSMSVMPGTVVTGALVSDNLHPSVLGAYLIGSRLADALNRVFARTRNIRVPTAAGANLLINGDLSGDNAGGTDQFTLGTGFTGTGPGRWGVSRTGSGIQAACSKQKQDGNDFVGRFRVAMSAAGAAFDRVLIQQALSFRLWSANGATSANRIFYVPATGMLYQPIVVGNLGATDQTATWPTTPGATFTDGAATLICVGQINVGGTIKYSGEWILNSLTAGQCAPYLRLDMRNTAGVNVLDHYAGYIDSTTGDLPTLQAGKKITLSESAIVPTTFDLENTTTSAGPQIWVTMHVVTQNSGVADFQVGPLSLSI